MLSPCRRRSPSCRRWMSIRMPSCSRRARAARRPDWWVGARIFGYYGRLLGISIDRTDSGPQPFRSELAALANDLASLLQLQETFQPQDFEINTDYLGEGYGRMGKPERDAIRLLAREEAVILDPVYTGRAMAGLLDMIDKGVFSRKQMCCSGIRAGRRRCLPMQKNF